MFPYLIVLFNIELDIPEQLRSFDNYLTNDITWHEIFIHNFISATAMIILGNLSGGLIAVLLLVYNASIVAIAAYIAFLKGDSIGYSIMIFLPHGIFEVPAIFCSFLLGMSTFKALINKIYSEEVIPNDSTKDKIAILIFMLLSLLVASIIESTVTPKFSAVFINN
nr:stage II sporulation protein M [Novibacillus thermophilus]